MENHNALENIDMYGEQVREVLSRPPHWLALMGSSIVFIFVVTLGCLSYYVKYPDILSGRITITSDVPTINLIAKTNGRIQKLYVTDNDKVSLGQKLALVENTSNSVEVYKLLDLLTTIDVHFSSNSFVNLPNYLSLGDIQTPYSNFVREYEALKIFRRSDNKEQQLAAYNK